MSRQYTRRQLLVLMGTGVGSTLIGPRLLLGAEVSENSGAETRALLPTVGTAFKQFSGIYPHLATFNNHGECGTGAVVPFAGRLWVVTYAPHEPRGSSDKLYEIDEALKVTIRPESVGGTPANRMIHRESNQLFIGPYAIDANRNVRVISPGVMPGRLTGTARHLSDPANKIYFATMEEGFYEVDVHTLAVKELYKDGNSTAHMDGDLLPGYHGKGFYSGQGRVVYANNGELSSLAQSRPDITSGVLAEWDGKDWKVVRRNQFTEVTGPGGIYGNSNPTDDPIWSIGWDHRSLILMLRQNGEWQSFRLPKSSHSYDGAHGWNTEWPRIRDIGERELLMTMHGAFWKFPRTLSVGRMGGIRPRSNYLKVIGDFARWNDKVVFGCDDTAQAEFLNKRKTKGNLAGPGQSHSNLWFVTPSTLDTLGTVLGRGALWDDEDVKSNVWSDSYLFAGYDHRTAFFSHRSSFEVSFELEIDRNGSGQWKRLRTIKVPPGELVWATFAPQEVGEWIRVRPTRDVKGLTLFFHYANANNQKSAASAQFDGLATTTSNTFMAGLVRVRGENKRTLGMAATQFVNGQQREVGYYELDAEMNLRRVDEPATLRYVQDNVAIPKDVISVDAASILYIDEKGKRWRLPKGDGAFDGIVRRSENRVDREVVTERDIFNVHGTFYELPAENAGGFAKIRPIASHHHRINDYCSYRGLMVMTGIEGGANNPHIIRSNDGLAAVWVGAIDDLWQLGKVRGNGGPCLNTPLRANMPSDPYLMTGYDRKEIILAHSFLGTGAMRVEIDITGKGDWKTYRVFNVGQGKSKRYAFPPGFAAYWVRISVDRDCNATALLRYS